MSRKPVPKVAAGGIAGAVSVLVIFAAQQFGVEIPGDVGAAIGVIVAFVASYLKPA